MNEIDYFKGDDMAAHAWRGKYGLDNEPNPDEMHWRLAKEFYRTDANYQKTEKYHKDLSLVGKSLVNNPLNVKDVYDFFARFNWIVPQGSIMSMLGNTKIGSLSNCFVIGQPEDSYGGIMQKDQELVQLMKRRGGVGLDISTLRPRGVNTNNAAKSSTGAASFMERFSNSTREVAQGGRRGALMLTIDCRHPDVLEFINAKKDRTKVTGANISVMLRDDFMEAVKKDEDYILRFPCDAKWHTGQLMSAKEQPYNVLVPVTDSRSNEVLYTKRVKAKEIFDAIVENAWENAEPGQMFINRHWNYSPDGVYPQYRGITTNPCGEIFMQAYDACRLMALNLFSFVENPFTDKAVINYDKLYYTAYIQQRLADNLVDLELEHIDRIISKIESDQQPDSIKLTELNLWKNIREVASNARRTGCGFTALGDMLAALGVKYDSKEGKDITDKVMRTKMEGELACTIDLAILRGTFDGWDRELENPFNEIHDETLYGNAFYEILGKEFPEEFGRMMKYGRRNVSWSTVAPTGTVSLMTQTTSGLEPLFMPYYIRKKKVNPGDEGVRVDSVDQNGDSWQHYPILHPKFKDWLERELGRAKHGIGVEQLTEEMLDEWFKKSPWYGSTANDINWIERVDIQGIIQKYTSHSISSTINLPSTVTQDEVAEIYLAAYDKGLKGVTVYRDGSRTGVLVSSETKEGFVQHNAPKRPRTLDCDIHHLSAVGKRWTVLVGLYDNKPYEIFTVEGTLAGKHDSGTLTKVEGGIYNLAVGDDTEKIYGNIAEGMTDEQAALTRLISTSLRHGADVQYVVEQLNKADGFIVSFTKAIARTLVKYVNEEELLSRATCQDCGSTNLRMEEGCVKCNDCGSSKCG